MQALLWLPVHGVVEAAPWIRGGVLFSMGHGHDLNRGEALYGPRLGVPMLGHTPDPRRPSCALLWLPSPGPLSPGPRSYSLSGWMLPGTTKGHPKVAPVSLPVCTRWP